MGSSDFDVGWRHWKGVEGSTAGSSSGGRPAASAASASVGAGAPPADGVHLGRCRCCSLIQDFPEARRPAYKIWVDFGTEFGVRKSSAQVTDLYTRDDLMGRQIVGVVNFPPKQIGPFRSEFLLTGFVREDGAVVIAVPER